LRNQARNLGLQSCAVEFIAGQRLRPYHGRIRTIRRLGLCDAVVGGDEGADGSQQTS
jgi:hypothetical protein